MSQTSTSANTTQRTKPAVTHVPCDCAANPYPHCHRCTRLKHGSHSDPTKNIPWDDADCAEYHRHLVQLQLDIAANCSYLSVKQAEQIASLVVERMCIGITTEEALERESRTAPLQISAEHAESLNEILNRNTVSVPPPRASLRPAPSPARATRAPAQQSTPTPTIKAEPHRRSKSGGSGKRMPSSTKEYLSMLKSHGFNAELTKGGHYSITHPQRPGFVTIHASSSSDVRSIKNSISQVKRGTNIDVRLNPRENKRKR